MLGLADDQTFHVRDRAVGLVQRGIIKESSLETNEGFVRYNDQNSSLGRFNGITQPKTAG